jgi:hypothetical protein
MSLPVQGIVSGKDRNSGKYLQVDRGMDRDGAASCLKTPIENMFIFGILPLLVVDS